MEGSGTATVALTGTPISGNYQRGIQVQSRLGTGRVNATIANNTLTGTEPSGLQGINLETAGSGTGHGNSICANMSNNNSTMAGGLSAYRLVSRGAANCTLATCAFQLQDFTGSGSNVADIQNWVTTTKSNVGSPITVTATQAFVVSPGPCPIP
jgi:hypothetical protein